MEKGYSPYTLISYKSDIRRWLDFLAREGISARIDCITTPVLRRYIVHLQQLNHKPATIARRINCIRSLWNFLVDSEYTSSNPCRKFSLPKKEQSLPTFLTHEELNALLSATDENHYVDLAFRDQAMLSVLIYTGIRRGELLNLTLDDVDLQSRTLTVRRTKGRKSRVIPLLEEAVKALHDWLERRPNVSIAIYSPPEPTSH